MPVQRKSPRLLDRVTDLPAAAQHDFPKPDIQIVQMGQNPIRTFAAPGMYVSHADFLAVRFNCIISAFESATCVRERMKSASVTRENEKIKIGKADVRNTLRLAGSP